jgi:hypothetical protein
LPSTTEDILAVRDELALLETGKGLKSMDEAWGSEPTTVGSKLMREREVDVYSQLAYAAIAGML